MIKNRYRAIVFLAVAMLSVGVHATLAGAATSTRAPQTGSASDDGKVEKGKKAKKKAAAATDAAPALAALAPGTGTVTVNGKTYALTNRPGDVCTTQGPTADSRAFKGYTTLPQRAYATIEVANGKAALDLTDIDLGDGYETASGQPVSVTGLAVTADGAAGIVITTSARDFQDKALKASFAFRC